ncbi:MAG: CotH kinase family protein [Clostridium sp.]|nr:CotH kinase family protein [Clostridium sp.]
MLADKKIIWGSVFIVLLLFSVGAFHLLEGSTLCGVTIESKEKLADICADKVYMEQVDNAKALILFERQPIPYDKESNCFYICQDVSEKKYNGVISAASEDIAIWIEADDYTKDKKEAVSQGHSFSVWIATKERYAVCNIVFTGLPVVELYMEAEPGTEYGSGSIAVWNPEDKAINAISGKDSDSLIKCSQNLETYTVKLVNQENIMNRKLSLLDMGKYDAWKLYAISAKDKTYIRSMLAYTLWNRINSVEKLDRACRYAELIVNDEYKGLFLLTPRVDDDSMLLDESGEVIHVEADKTQKAYDNENFYMTQASHLDNLIEYFIFLEAAYAYENIMDDLYIVRDDKAGESYLVPGKIEYSFGIFPNRMQYMTWQREKRILTGADLGIADEKTCEYLAAQAEKLWQSLRESAISDEVLATVIEEQKQYLYATGFIARSGNNSIDAADYEESIGELTQYLLERMEVLDRYYGAEE